MTSLRTAALIFIAAFVARAHEGNRFRADLVGTEETPLTLFTPASGEFRARAVANDTRIEFRLTYENLTTPTVAAHVHFGKRGLTGGVSFFLCGGGSKPPCPPSPATVTGTVTAADVIGPVNQGINPGNLAAILEMMRAGFAYANVHTTRFPTGEIRGQLNANADDDRD